MNKRNYQKELDKILQKISKDEIKKKKTLFLHVCCAPCSSYVLEYLHQYFDITVFFYNPNITEKVEYEKRKEELKRYIESVEFGREIKIRQAIYEDDLFLQKCKGYENEPERGKRCKICFELRLEETAKIAKENGFDYFCTSLSISPHKDADLLMEIGEKLANKYDINYLPSDFKKKNGYKRSIELSHIYNLYRQNYCGCIFSKRDALKERRKDA